MFAFLAAVVAGIWFVCALLGTAGGFPFLPLFLCLFALSFAYVWAMPGPNRR